MAASQYLQWWYRTKEAGDNMKLNNIIQFERNAEFYFDLGYKYIQKGNLKVALRHIEKATKLKPNDGFILFNYAGLLAELGDISLSTEVLENIVENIDPNYSECFFGLGCNYLQLQKIKKAIEYFNQYLKIDPDGEFSEEAEDLLEMLIMIKDANNDLDDDELDKLYELEEEAINHLEKREYETAVKKFERVVQTLPNAVPARNNLSLTYYYIGNIDRAIELVKEVLQYEPENIHANCNLAIYYSKQKSNNWVDKQVREIKKLTTDNSEYMYKIADTLGCLRRHKDAYKYYKRLIGMDSSNTLYLHYGAIAAYNSKMYTESIILWEKLEELEPDNFLTDYYINKAQNSIEDTDSYNELLYVYQLPKDEITSRLDKIYRIIELSEEKCKEHLRLHPEDKDIIYFGMNFDKAFLRVIIYTKIKHYRINALEAQLLQMLLRKDVEDHIKIETVFMLDLIGAEKPYKVQMQEKEIYIIEEALEYFELKDRELLEDIKNTAVANMKGRYEDNYADEVQKLWYDFIKYSYPELPSLLNADAWAGALEYAYCKCFKIKNTQAAIAKRYGTSAATLGEKYRNISRML